MGRLLLRLVGTVVLGLALVLAYAWAEQRRIVFQPPAARPVTLPLGGAPWRLPVPGGPEAVAFWLPAADSASARALLYLHGNAELAGASVGAFERLRAAGWHVLLVEYPGYGDASGTPSQATTVAAAQAAFDALAARRPEASRRIVAYGRSLGGGVAAQLAATRPVAGLVLESTFTSLRALRPALVPAWLVRDPFDSRAALDRYDGPRLVLHGRRDAVIPFAHGEALAALRPGTQLIEMPCGHNDCVRPWDEIEAFLEECGE